MGKRSKLILACLATAAVLSLAAGSADARNFRISIRNIRSTWTALRFVAAGNTVTCHVTLEGSFVESTAGKTIRILLARFTRATLNTCTGGSATVLSATLPWHLRYHAFIGTLPFILIIQTEVIGLSFSVKPEGSLTCLAATEESHPATFNFGLERGGEVTETSFAREAEIPLTGEGGLCAFGGSGHLEGTGRAEEAAGGTRIKITLI